MRDHTGMCNSLCLTTFAQTSRSELIRLMYGSIAQVSFPFFFVLSFCVLALTSYSFFFFKIL